ncbi:MAG: DUF2156 domain-containing protein [Myxococcaceae bacterium]|nr:DUF2156 domain-containing protein [Myxococcaceae bacterium]
MTALVRAEVGVIDHPSGYLALSPRNAIFSREALPGFIAYRDQGRHLVMFGGVHAPEAAREPLLDAFLAEAERRGRRALAVQVREEQGDLFRSRGFTVNRFGSTYGVELQGYSFAGGAKVNLRNKIKRARAAGLTVLEVGRELPATADTFMKLQAVSDAWLGEKKKKELDFMIGELGVPADPDRRIFVVLDSKRAFTAFITYVPAYGRRGGWLHDLTRRVPDAPVGCMELCNQVAIERLAADGAQWLHFGFTPFLVEGDEGPGASPVVAWVLRLLGRFGAALYPAQQQREYKKKWLPSVVEPELVAFRPLSLRAIWDLLVLTRSV